MRVITLLKARKLIIYDAWTFLASVTDVSDIEKIVSTIPMDKKLEHLFPMEFAYNNNYQTII